MRQILIAILTLALSTGCEQKNANLIDTGTTGPVCYMCDGAKACLVSKSGGTNCKVVADQTGRSCTVTLNCGMGNAFGGAFTLYAAPEGNDVSDQFEKRINRYLSANVVPLAKDCIGVTGDKGAVVLKHIYIRDKSSANWELRLTEVVSASVEEASADRLAVCVEKASEGQLLPVDSKDGDNRMLTLFWEWPVPFPTD